MKTITKIEKLLPLRISHNLKVKSLEEPVVFSIWKTCLRLVVSSDMQMQPPLGPHANPPYISTSFNNSLSLLSNSSKLIFFHDELKGLQKKKLMQKTVLIKQHNFFHT